MESHHPLKVVTHTETMVPPAFDSNRHHRLAAVDVARKFALGNAGNTSATSGLDSVTSRAQQGKNLVVSSRDGVGKDFRGVMVTFNHLKMRLF